MGDDDPREAADIANAIVDRYQTMRDVSEDQYKERTDTLQKQISRQEEVVEKGQAALRKIGKQQSPDYLNAKLLLDQESSGLQSLRQNLTSTTPTTNLPTRILSHAQVPTEPSQPQKSLCYFLATIASVFLAVVVASFVEVAFLIAGAGKKRV